MRAIEFMTPLWENESPPRLGANNVRFFPNPLARLLVYVLPLRELLLRGAIGEEGSAEREREAERPACIFSPRTRSAGCDVC